MSRVILLSAERPMPLYEPELRRMSVSGGFTVETPGFSVQTHEYYRDAVDDLGLEMKPFSYELNLEATVEDAEQLVLCREEIEAMGIQVRCHPLLAMGQRARHDSAALATVLMDVLRNYAVG